MTERARFVFVFTQIRRNMSQINISHSSSSPGICPDSWLIDLSFYSEAASFRLLIVFYVNWSELYPWSKASYWLRQELKLKAKLGVVDQWPTRLICVFVERRSKIKLMIDYVVKQLLQGTQLSVASWFDCFHSCSRIPGGWWYWAVKWILLQCFKTQTTAWANFQLALCVCFISVQRQEGLLKWKFSQRQNWKSTQKLYLTTYMANGACERYCILSDAALPHLVAR